MSWDVLILSIPDHFDEVNEMPHDYSPEPLGDRALVRERVAAVFENVDWSDPSWGMWLSKPGTIQFSVGRTEPVEHMMLHVRADERVVPLILELCSANPTWRAIDCSYGDFLERNPYKGLCGWIEFRNRVIDEQHDS